MHILDSFDKKTLRDDIPEFAPGDTVKVHVNIIEGKTARVQVFQGYVMGRQGHGVRRPSASARCPSASAWSACSRCTPR